VLGVKLDGFIIILRLALPNFHEVNSDAIVGQGFSVYVSDRSTDLEELLILFNG
jgi:hypothetical protein